MHVYDVIYTYDSYLIYTDIHSIYRTYLYMCIYICTQDRYVSTLYYMDIKALMQRWSQAKGGWQNLSEEAEQLRVPLSGPGLDFSELL